MLTPQDPEAFRAKVLRRAMQIERRRRRARALMGVPAVIAIVLAAVVAFDRGGTSPTVVAGEGAGAVTSEAIDLPVDGTPWAVVAGADGAMWVLAHGHPATLTRFPSGGEPVVSELSDGIEPDVVVAGTDRAIWLVDADASLVLRVEPSGEVTTWATDAAPASSATWQGGRLWFPEPTLDRITGIASDGDTVHFDVPRGRAPTVVTAGPDAAVWYSSSTSARIGSVSATGAVNELDLGDDDDRALAMTTGPGPAVWLVVASADHRRLAHVDANGDVIVDDVELSSIPDAISPGPDGRIWFTLDDDTVQQRSGARLTVRQLGRPLDASSWGLAPDDAMWAVDRDRSLLLKITID